MILWSSCLELSQARNGWEHFQIRRRLGVDHESAILSSVCGRYRLSRRKQIIEEYFDAAPWDDDWSPRYNIAPTQPVPVIRQHPKEPIRQISSMLWGLIPQWAKDASGAASTINLGSAEGRVASRRMAWVTPQAVPAAS